MNRAFIIAIFVFPALQRVAAQQQPIDTSHVSVMDSVWSFEAEADYYIYPQSGNIMMVTMMADKSRAHGEARYNYEAKNTASVFGGMNFTIGNRLKLDLTPMVGLVFGSTNGVAPGLEAELSYRRFFISTQTEWLVDFSGKENNFVYTWSELGADITDHITAGMVVQRTTLYKSDLDLQRGAYAQYTFQKLTGSFYYFNPFSNGYFFVIGLRLAW